MFPDKQLRYEEVRAFAQGLAQAARYLADCKVQTYSAANALGAQRCGQRLTWQRSKRLRQQHLHRQVHHMHPDHVPTDDRSPGCV